MRLLTHKEGDQSTCFDKIDGTRDEIGITLSIQLTFNNHLNPDNESKINCHLPQEHDFRFCETFEIVTKGLGIELQLKTSITK